MKNYIFETSSDNLGFSNICTYWGYFKTDSLADSYLLDSDFEKGYIEFNQHYFWDHFDNSKYMAAIEEAINDQVFILVDALNDAGLTCVIDAGCSGSRSPKYYNYGGDRFWLDFEVESSEKLIGQLEALLLNNLDFDKFLRENYSSYDGFLSHTSNNLRDWHKDLLELESNSISAAFTYLIRDNINVEDFSFCVYEAFNYSNFYTDFVLFDSLDDCVNDLKKGLFYDSSSYSGVDDEMYSSLVKKYIELPFNYMATFDENLEVFRNKYPDLDFDFEGYLTQKFNEIDSKTLKLF